ncbi:MAG: response regulator transcription factor [Ktedonobacterales bacterium]
MRILLVEDNRRLSAALKASLADAGYAVDAAFDGPEGQAFAENGPYDAIVLDVMLPGSDGLTVCRALRQRRVNVPIMMLTARDTVQDRVRGLDSGADDYLVKPFALSELLARLRALLRRDADCKAGVLEAGELRLDPATHEVTRAGHAIELTARLFALLEYFVRHPNQILTRELIESHIWSYDFAATSNVVDVYVRRLRTRLDDPFAVKLLETVRGAGYRLRVPS